MEITYTGSGSSKEERLPVFFYFFLPPKAQAVIIAVRGMDRMTPMLPATALMSSMEKKAELMS